MKNISLYEKIPSIENNFSVKLREYRTAGRLLPHWHEHIELLYFREGICDFICNGKSFSATVGDLVVVNSTEIHSFLPSREVEYICILLYPSFFSDIATPDTPIKNLICHDPVVSSLISALAEESRSDAPCTDMIIKGKLYELVAYLYRVHPYTAQKPKDKKARASMLERLNTVMKHITENYAEKITTKALADMCYLSEAHFCRFFKGAVGKTATEYINGYRIEKAAILLRNTDGSIAEIAAAVGFDDINYFSRVFKSVMGISPGKYRVGVW